MIELYLENILAHYATLSLSGRLKRKPINPTPEWECLLPGEFNCVVYFPDFSLLNDGAKRNRLP